MKRIRTIVIALFFALITLFLSPTGDVPSVGGLGGSGAACLSTSFPLPLDEAVSTVPAYAAAGIPSNPPFDDESRG